MKQEVREQEKTVRIFFFFGGVGGGGGKSCFMPGVERIIKEKMIGNLKKWILVCYFIALYM